MQTKKDDIRENIMEAATDEFLKRGYEESSMRTIARKANTTLGNIYHYFANKEALLEAVLEPTIEELEKFLEEHVNTSFRPCTIQEARDYLDHMEEEPDASELKIFMDRRIVIFLNLRTTGLLKKKERIMALLGEHLKWHLDISDKDAHYSELVMNMLMESVKHVLIEHDDPKQAKIEFIRFFRMICTGIVEIKR